MDQKIYTQMRQVEDSHWWFNGRKNIISHVLSTLNLPTNGLILDAGCGTGGNLELLSRFGHVKGVEFDDEAISMAKNRQVGEISKGRFPDEIPFPPETFDLVVLLDVLEHIDDDLNSLLTLSGLMKQSGRLVITVPAFPFLWGQHDEQHHHKRRYVAASLQDVIEKAGLRLNHLSYFNTWLFPVVVATRLFEKAFPPHSVGEGLHVPIAPVNKALEAIFSSERHLVARARIPFGVSLLAIAEKA